MVLLASLLLDYPAWFIILCLAAGAGLSYLTYQKNNIAAGEGRFSWPVWLLALMRAMSVSLLAFLLLGPVFKAQSKKTERPVVVLGADNSASVAMSADSARYRAQMNQKLDSIERALSDRFEVKRVRFSGDLEDEPLIDFTGQSTNLSSYFNGVFNRYYGDNLGAVVTLTDGIYNRGTMPQPVAARLGAPQYFVALGDTTPQRDAAIAEVLHNEIAYTGNKVPLAVRLRAYGYPNTPLRLMVTHRGNVVHSETLAIDQQNFFREGTVTVPANHPGLQRYRVEISHLAGELTYQNNTYDAFIDVLDSRRKVLIVAGAPHPDVAALKNSIDRNSYYEVEAGLVDDLEKTGALSPARLKNYQLVVFHGLPGQGGKGQTAIRNADEAGVAQWFVVSSNISLSHFNQLGTGLQITSTGRLNEVMPANNELFSGFSQNPELNPLLPKLTPIQVPFGEYNLTASAQVVLKQQVGRVVSNMPLLALFPGSEPRKAVMTGEGIWRWFLYGYAETGNHDVLDDLTGKVVQYLAVKTDSRPFRVRSTKRSFFEGENITFEAELYNQAFEPVREAAISLSLTDENKKQYDYRFAPRGSAYLLDAGVLPEGTYAWLARTTLAGRTLEARGEVLVKRVELESTETVANHGLLHNIARESGGKVFAIEQTDQLVEALLADERLVPVAYMQTSFSELIEEKWYFFVWFLLVGAEWFLRKFFGSY